MSTTAPQLHYDYPYRLRIVHGDRAELTLERKGQWFVIDPASPPPPGSVVLSSQGEERSSATPGSVTIDGVTIERLAYLPPARALPRRLRPLARAAVTSWAPPTPHVLHFTFPDGARLLHLGLSLHRGTPSAWLDEVAQRFGNADWTLVGLPYGEADAVVGLLPRVGPNRVLITELTNTDRREAGLPTELVTPLRDRLVALGIDAHVFATHVSYRFE